MLYGINFICPNNNILLLFGVEPDPKLFVALHNTLTTLMC